MNFLERTTILFFVLTLVSCVPDAGNSSSVSSTITNTASPTQTASQTVTPTPTLKPTITPIPTPLGGVSPKLAYYGQSNAGKTYIYAGEIYSNSIMPLIEISPVIPNLNEYPVKWSDDGSNLIYVGRDQSGKSGLFVYDGKTGENENVMNLPENDLVSNIFWSPDLKQISFSYTPSYFTGGNRIQYRLLDLDTKRYSDIDNWVPEAWGVGPRESSTQDSNGNQVIQINYPEKGINSIRQWSFTDAQSGTTPQNFSLISEDKKETLIASFPGDVFWNGSLMLNISPDANYAIKYCLGNGLFYPVEFSKIPYTLSQQDLVEFATNYYLKAWETQTAPNSIFVDVPLEIQEIKKNNYSIMMDWSPDSQLYVYESNLFYYAKPGEKYYQDYKDAWHFTIKSIKTGEVIYEYYPPVEIDPLVLAIQGYSGFDVVWPTQE